MGRRASGGPSVGRERRQVSNSGILKFEQYSNGIYSFANARIQCSLPHVHVSSKQDKLKLEDQQAVSHNTTNATYIVTK
jgi:hypothetical protein